MKLTVDEQSDALYLRLDDSEITDSQETDEGLLLVRRQDDDEVAGMTVVNWWKRFGSGPLPDSIAELERAIEPWAARLAA